MSWAGLPVSAVICPYRAVFTNRHFFLLFQYTCFLEANYLPISCSTANEGYLERETGAAQKPKFTKHCHEWIFAPPLQKAGWCNFRWQHSIWDPGGEEPGLARVLYTHTPRAMPPLPALLHRCNDRAPKNWSRCPTLTGIVSQIKWLAFAFIFWNLFLWYFLKGKMCVTHIA